MLAKDDGVVETTIPVSIELFACRAVDMSHEGLCQEPTEEVIEESTCLVSFTVLPIRNLDLCETLG